MADVSLATIQSSNLPSSQKSAIRRLYESMGGSGSALDRVRAAAVTSGEAIRQGGESVVVGAVLGAAHVYLPQGLNMKVGQKVNVPIDAAAGALLMGAAVLMSDEPVAEDLRNAGASALSVFSFRKTYEVLAKKRAPGGKFAGEDGWFAGADPSEDPVIAAARALD